MYRAEVLARVRRRARPRHPRSRLRRRDDVRRHGHVAGADGRVDDARLARGRQSAATCSALTATRCRSPTSRSKSVLLVAVLEHTREPWRVLAEAQRVLKPGGRVIMVVPNDATMSVGRLLLRKFPIRYPDHLTFTTPGRMRRWLARRLPDHRGISRCRSGRCRSRPTSTTSSLPRNVGRRGPLRQK